jgi:ribosome-associated protein
MAKKKKSDNPEALVDAIVKGLDDRKAKEIVCLDLREIKNTICDYFVVCHGDSNTHVAGLLRAVEEQTLKDLKEKPWHVEGSENAEWILLDYVNVVVHIFQKDAREFYKIEDLWADAVVTKK